MRSRILRSVHDANHLGVNRTKDISGIIGQGNTILLVNVLAALE